MTLALRRTNGRLRRNVAAVILSAAGVSGAEFATMDKALDERTIGHNPERLSLLQGGIVFSNQACPA